MNSKSKQDLLQIWKAEEQCPFIGWDFSHLEDRMFEEKPPWSYLELAEAKLSNSTAALDMGTAEGKRLLQLKKYWPKKVAVTEEYRPNFLLAQENLTPLGVGVHNVRLTHTDPMPFDNEEFDLILNRHSAFNSSEVGRILTHGGVFFTQQVHGLDLEDLMAVFGAKPKWPDSTPENYVVRLQNAGLKMDNVRDWTGSLTFADVGAIVYYLKAIPWTVDGFSVGDFQDQLFELQNQLDRGELLTFKTRKYLLQASKPA